MRKRISRRDFGKLSAGASLATVAGCSSDNTQRQREAAAPAVPPAGPTTARGFPKGFYWGTATSAFQNEGAWNEDGKGPSIWDTFSHTPGKIVDGTNADVAIDHYHRYKEDVKLMKDLGATAYRFSFSWPRIFPNGAGQPNAKGLDFYDRLTEELKAAGIEPFATLYHWDLPQALQDKGGWQSREIPKAFADYASYMAEKLSDRVRHFFTINEFPNFVDFGYGNGLQAPGVKLPPGPLNQVRHHSVLAHGLAVQAIRASGKQGTKVGMAEAVRNAVPVVETPENIRAAASAMRELNAGYMTVMMEGKYTDAYLEEQGANAPKFTPEELRIISSPVDFVGMNIYYARHLVQASDSKLGYDIVPYQPTSAKAMYPGAERIFWDFSPEAMYWGPRQVADVWHAREIYITENGVPFAHEPGGKGVQPDVGGVENDSDRIVWLRAYLAQLQRATAEGVPVRGYFHWTLVDNFEWFAGRGPKYGLYRVDMATNNRSPKLSARWFREMTRRNAAV